MLKRQFPIVKILLASFLFLSHSTFIHALTIDELSDRSISSNGVVWLDKAGDDSNPGTAALPVATISEAIKKSYAYGQAVINVSPGIYSSSSEHLTGGHVWISGHPRVLIRRDPSISGTVTFNAGFRIQNGSTVLFRDVNFNQNGNMGGIRQVLVENSSVFIDDFNATYTSGGVGFLRLINSYGSLRVISDRNSYINYSNYDQSSAIVEADYGSYLFIAGDKDDQRRVEILTSETGATGIYLTGSNIYASNLRIQGKGNKGVGLLLNRGSRGRILSHAGQVQSWFYRFNTGILSQNGSSVYLSGPIRVRLNNIGLSVQSGADVRYSNDVLIDSNTIINMQTPAVLDNILKAY